MFLDWLFPPVCPGCGGGRGGDFCPACRPSPLALTLPCGLAVAAGSRYEGAMRQAVLDLKHLGRTVSAAPVAGAMLRALDARPDVVVEVPGAPERRRLRGVHVPGLLARQLAQRLGRPHRPDLLRPCGPLLTQKGLSRDERDANVRGRFSAGAARGLRVLLVDDVMTTGATLAECARALRSAAVRDVRAVVAAAVV